MRAPLCGRPALPSILPAAALSDVFFSLQKLPTLSHKANACGISQLSTLGESVCEIAARFSQLMDLTQVTNVEFGTEDLRRLAQRSIFSPDSRRAILVSSDVVFGLSRMFEIFRETLGETGIRVFRNLDDALEWVLAKNTAV